MSGGETSSLQHTAKRDQVIPTPLHVLGRISPIFFPFFPFFARFHRLAERSNEPLAGTQGQETVARAPKHRFSGLANSGCWERMAVEPLLPDRRLPQQHHEQRHVQRSEGGQVTLSRQMFLLARLADRRGIADRDQLCAHKPTSGLLLSVNAAVTSVCLGSERRLRRR